MGDQEGLSSVNDLHCTLERCYAKVYSRGGGYIIICSSGGPVFVRHPPIPASSKLLKGYCNFIILAASENLKLIWLQCIQR